MTRGSSTLLVFLLSTVRPGIAAEAAGPFTTTEQVGRTTTNRVITPVNQVLTPYGAEVELPGMRPQVLALSPNGRLLATSGKTSEVVIVDPSTGTILQRVALPPEKLNE